jgi:hypothetical protein
MNIFCVYTHSRETDGKIFYVGKGRAYRARSVSGRSAYWHRIVEKHGYTIRIVKSGMNEECSLSLERALIAALGRENLCNHTDGGDGCRNPSEETRHKMSVAKISKIRSEETIEKWRQKVAGRKMPKEAIEKTRMAHIGSKRNDESKARMSASARARWEAIEPSFAVVCGLTGEIHDSCYDAAMWLRKNGHPKAEVSAVKQAATGKRLTAYGRTWTHV